MESGHRDSKPVVKITSIDGAQFAKDFDDCLSRQGQFARKLHAEVLDSLGLSQDQPSSQTRRKPARHG